MKMVVLVIGSLLPAISFDEKDNEGSLTSVLSVPFVTTVDIFITAAIPSTSSAVTALSLADTSGISLLFPSF